VINVEISGLKSAYKHASQRTYGANMSISAALVVERVERIENFEQCASRLLSLQRNGEEYPLQIDKMKILLEQVK
tara:strand:+ start:419 stop:643 length:225 start_codon:yes stop_codon:yes gene_type:complete